jgi:hypothetical protein
MRNRHAITTQSPRNHHAIATQTPPQMLRKRHANASNLNNIHPPPQVLDGCVPMDIDFGVSQGVAACVSAVGGMSTVAFYK